MNAAFPLQWLNPYTWSWFTWLWLVLFIGGFSRQAWRWFQRRRAVSWPTAQGRIEGVTVRRKEQFPFSISRTPRGRAPAFTAELSYSYGLEGERYWGFYDREFGTEGEGWEFVRDLKDKSVAVSYSPRDHAKSALTEEAVNMLLRMRPPAPEGSHTEESVENVPGWMKPLLWPFIGLSGVGLVLSLWVHAGALAGKRVAPEHYFWMLQVGIFVVWFPAVFVSAKRVGTSNRKDYWTLVLRGSPDWMRYVVYGFFGYAFLNFALFMMQAPNGGGGANPPAVVWRGFSGHWMLFYSAALAILYSAVAEPNARCINGHTLSSGTVNCSICGQPVTRPR
jgi:hypothetical protein